MERELIPLSERNCRLDLQFKVVRLDDDPDPNNPISVRAENLLIAESDMRPYNMHAATRLWMMEEHLSIEHIVYLANELLPRYRPAFFPDMTYAERRPYITDVVARLAQIEQTISRNTFLRLMQQGPPPADTGVAPS